MNRFFSGVSLILIAIVLHVATADAQLKAPFEEGETLTYEGKISKIISVGPVADLTLTVARAGGNDYLIRAEAKSKGTLLKVIRYSFYQKFESTIDDNRFRVTKTVKHDAQKDRVRDSEALFDYGDKRVTWTEVDPKDPNKAPRRIASEIEGTTHDLISGVYSLRMLPLVVGQTFELQVSDSGLVYDVPVKVTARELQKTEIGRVMCFRVEPQIFGPGRLIENDGKMIIWISDDARRLPVRSLVNAPIGKIDIRLKSVANRRDTAQTAKNN